MEAHITIDEKIEPSIYGGTYKAYGNDLDDWGIQIGDFSVSGLHGWQACHLAILLTNALIISGYDFEFVNAVDRDVRYKMKQVAHV